MKHIRIVFLLILMLIVGIVLSHITTNQIRAINLIVWLMVAICMLPSTYRVIHGHGIGSDAIKLAFMLTALVIASFNLRGIFFAANEIFRFRLYILSVVTGCFVLFVARFSK